MRPAPIGRNSGNLLVSPIPAAEELVLEGEVVAAADGLDQLGTHGGFGGEAGGAAEDGEGGADAGGGVRLEQGVGVEGGGVESFGGLAPAFPVQELEGLCGEVRPVHVGVGRGPAGVGGRWDSDVLGDGPVHVLLPYGDAVGVDGRHLLQRSAELLPPGVWQVGGVLEDRVGGQDRLVDAPGQLCPVGGAVVDGVVDGQERGPVTVEVTEGVLGIEGAVPSLPDALSCGVDTSRSHAGCPSAVQAGAPRVRPAHPQNSPPVSTCTCRTVAARAWWVRMRRSVSGSAGGEYISDPPQLDGGQARLSDGLRRFLPVWRTGSGDEDVRHSWAGRDGQHARLRGNQVWSDEAGEVLVDHAGELPAVQWSGSRAA